jgi:cobalt/nickel transport system permease protein
MKIVGKNMGIMESIRIVEQENTKESIIHSLDGRIKLITLILIIVYAVYTTDILILAITEVYLLALILISKISFTSALKRILLLLPFGGFIAVFQPFIRPGDVIYVLPFGIDITYQGLIFGILLMSRLIVSLTAIVLLSSVTPMQDIISSFRKLGMPREFAMMLSLMIRYLFMFYDELEKIRNAQKSRNFSIWNKKTSYTWRLKQVAYTIGMMFLHSYEKGETVYYSMLSRGYSDHSNIYNQNQKLSSWDFTFVGVTILLVLILELMNFTSLI